MPETPKTPQEPISDEHYAFIKDQVKEFYTLEEDIDRATHWRREGFRAAIVKAVATIEALEPLDDTAGVKEVLVQKVRALLTKME